MISRKKEWFDNDKFWRELYPFMFPEVRFTQTDEQIDKVLSLTNPTGTAVLDLCTGPGRCAIALAKRGFSVTGVDKSNFLLNKARARARNSKTKINFVRQDMRDFVRPGSYDLVINMFTSFGYFDHKPDDMTVLKNMFISLRVGGICLIEVIGKECLARVFQPTSSERLSDGTTLIQRHEVFDEWTRIRNEWLLIRQGRVKGFTFHHTLYSGQELRDRMEKVGFVGVSLYGNFEGEEYGPSAERLIALGLKPRTTR